MVVDLPVEGDLDNAIFIGHWLAPTAHVYDREAAVAESNGAIQPNAGVVWPTMGKRIPHRDEPRRVHTTVQSVRNGYPTDAAHNFSSFGSVNCDRRFVTAVTMKKWPRSARTCSKPARCIALVTPPIV